MKAADSKQKILNRYIKRYMQHIKLGMKRTWHVIHASPPLTSQIFTNGTPHNSFYVGFDYDYDYDYE